MTLGKNIIDTMKEWQIKIGSFNSNIRLYYPKNSLCRYLDLNIGIDNELLCRHIETNLSDNNKELGDVTVCADGDRFCILIGKKGCDYVEKEVAEPEFLIEFLELLKNKNLQTIVEFFEEYARERGTKICTQKEEGGLETILYFENEDVEPYVYCIDQNEFGITYHRFTREDYQTMN